MSKVELSSTQIAFLENYLDADLPDPDDAEDLVLDLDEDALDLSDLWLLARNDADAAIEELRAALLGHDEPNLRRIAEFGLLDLMDGHHVKVTKGILNYSAAGPADRPARAAALSTALADLDTHLGQSPFIDLVEDNAFDIPVAIRVPLRRAITAINKRIAT